MPDIINSNFDPRLPFPLDVRQQVQNMNALFMIPATSRWEGMVVYVRSAELPYILRGGTDNTFWQPFEFNGGGGLLPNGIVVYGEAQQSGNNVLLNDGWVWRINQVDYQSSDDTIAITPAASGNLRVDIIVGNASSEFVKVVGTEVAGPGPAVEPNIPADTVPLVRVDVNDTGIVAIEDFVLSAFVRYDINDQNLNPAHRQNARTNIQAVSKDTDDTRTGGLTNEGKVTVDLDEASAALPIVEIKQQGVTKHVFTGDEARILPKLLRVNTPVSPTDEGAAFRGGTNGGDPIFEIQNAAGTKIFYPRGTGGIGQLRSNASDESIRRDENYLTFPATVAGTGKLNDVALADGVGMVKFAATVTEVSGIVSNNSDQKELLVWTDNTDGITLTEQDTDSVAANRFLREINVPYRTPVRIVYESSTGRWVNGNTGELQETDARYFEVVDDVLTLKYILPDIAALQAFVRGPAVLAYVYDPNVSSFFHYVTEGDFDGVADGAEIIPAQDGGYWIKSRKGPFSSVLHQIVRPEASTSWVKLYDVSLPERGGVDPDVSANPYYDFAVFDGTLYVHGLRAVSGIGLGSRGERFLESFPFQARFIGWRDTYRIDESYLYVDGKLKIADNTRDLIRIVKVSRLNYEVHVRQEFENMIFGVETKYFKASGATLSIDGNTAADPVVAPAEIVWDKDNYLPYDNQGTEAKLPISNPKFNVLYPNIVDGNGNISLNQWKPQEAPYARTGVVRQLTYAASPYGYGTETSGLPDSLTPMTIGDRNFIRFKLERNQATSPERSELSSITPQTAYGGADDVRWFGGFIRANYFNDTQYPRQDETVLCQFLPDYTTTVRPPCQYLAIREGRYIWRMASNYRGNENVSETTKETLFDLGPVSWGSFEKWVMQCKFNYDAGFLKVWKNDILLIDFEGPTTWDDTGGYVPYIKFGVYKAFWGNRPVDYVTPTNLVEIDHMDTRWGNIDSDYDSISPFSIEDYEQLNIDINSKISDIEQANIVTADVTTANVDTATIQTINLPVALVAENFGGATTTNADDLLLSGWYELLSSNPGIPVINAGILSVARSGATISQVFLTTVNFAYIRVRSGGIWSAWKRVLDESDLTTANITTANITTANITTANADILNLGGTTTTSADSLLTSGWYDLASGNAGIPIAISGILRVARSGSIIHQIYTTTTNFVYTRFRSGGVWTSWKRLAEFYVGTTASRPTATFTGQQYYDTTLTKPIWWDGTDWKDATGTIV